MKAVISNRIYMDIKPSSFNELDKALTYKIEATDEMRLLL